MSASDLAAVGSVLGDTGAMVFSSPWPQEPRLNPFRDAVWELSQDGRALGYVITTVVRMRSLPAFWVKREWLWYQVHWLDGRQDPPDEDDGPDGYAVVELEEGRFDPRSDGDVFGAKRMDEPERSRLCRHYGPPG